MAHQYPVSKLQKVLLSTDGSEYSAGAVREAIRLAKNNASKLFVLSVIETNPEFDTLAPQIVEKTENETREQLEAVKKMAVAEGVECEVIARHTEVPYEAVVEEAKKIKADMIVMGRRGRTGLKRLLMGSVTARVIGHSPCNVLVVPRAADITCKNILTASDGSRFSAAAAEEAIGIAKRSNSNLFVLSVAFSEGASPFDIVHSEMNRDVVAREELAQAEKNAREVVDKAVKEGLHARAIVVGGRPYEAIVETAREHNVDLIVVGSHGRTGLGRLLMGSVTERVVGHADCAVMIVKTE